MWLECCGLDRRICNHLEPALDRALERHHVQLCCWGFGICHSRKLRKLALVSTALVSGAATQHLQLRCCPSQRIWLEVSWRLLAACNDSQWWARKDHTGCWTTARKSAKSTGSALSSDDLCKRRTPKKITRRKRPQSSSKGQAVRINTMVAVDA